MMKDTTPRWHYRFKNYQRAFTLLREAVETSEEKGLSQLEKEGLIQRFEYTMELAWKTMKDYLESEGMVIAPVTPGNVIRLAFEAHIITDGQVWMDALDSRNKMSHTYDFAQFEAVIVDIKKSYLAAMENAYDFFSTKCLPMTNKQQRPHGLLPRQVELLRQILTPYAQAITRVDLFGSRAEGQYRHNSDIDMVIHGELHEKDIDRLHTLFLESSLPFSVDVKSYALTQYAPLKRHMDMTQCTLFTKEDLVKRGEHITL